MVDCVEKTELYKFYDKQDLYLYISSFYVMLQASANALGAYCGSFTADVIGYTWAFTSGGLVLIAFATVYAVVCGSGGTQQPAEEYKEETD